MVDVPIPNDPAVMDQFGREFIPRLLVAREGQAVLFKNSEDELHTVHVQDDAVKEESQEGVAHSDT